MSDFSIALPTIPTGILVLLAFFSPYAIAALNALLPFIQRAWQRKLLSVGFSVGLGGAVSGVYVGFGGTFVGLSWGALIVLAVLIVAASYALLTKASASRVETAVEASL